MLRRVHLLLIQVDLVLPVQNEAVQYSLPGTIAYARQGDILEELR